MGRASVYFTPLQTVKSIGNLGPVNPKEIVIYVDGDGCPVKESVYRCAARYSLKTILVSNRPLAIPKGNIESIVVGAVFDAVDDWIESHVTDNDIVVTNDILLADRVIKKGARVINPRGKILNEDNIGEALATRELMQDLRHMGALDTGPKAMGKKHHSNFLAGLDTLINKVRNA